VLFCYMHQINSQIITFSDVHKVMFDQEKVSLGKEAKKKVQKTRDAIEKAVKNREVIYGVTTGFGAFKTVAIDGNQVQELQKNLILSHAVGVGEYFCDEIVRGVMFLMANYLSKGYSGVRPIVIQTLIEMLNRGVIPLVPQKGSVGSSGDLAPSAHVILVVIGEGEARYQGKKMTGAEALKKAGITPVVLEAKEGLALINNTATMTSNAVHAVTEAEKLLRVANISAALSAEALRATTKAYDPNIHKIRPHAGQIQTAKTMIELLFGSTMIDNSKTQDQYSLRCIPQIHGAVVECFEYAKKVVNTEVNSVTDNPLIFTDKKGKVKVISGGNFHGEPVAIAMDALGMAVCEIANVSDRRITSILDPATNNGLPAFLVEKGGLNSGMMILQYTTASLVSENKVLAHPASVDSIPTSANVEDLVSMGTISARKAVSILENIKHVLAIELIVACQAIDFRLKEKYKLAKKTKKAYEEIRKHVPYFKKDAIYYPYITRLVQIIDEGVL
jgi:histidine ammonia-lyase